jgi:DNA gyrase subunit A
MVNDVEISKTMKSSYLEYSMSVIIGRAIPDARDGMKPVQRRILYAMSDLGITSKSSYKKSARIVGDVIGKYHPHGDTAVYDALVRLAQPFNMRETIVDGQGNFGSIDGDSAAAMRYTEARMTRLGEEILADLKKDTVNWTDNYDNSLKEPEVLPTRVPTLLLNGSSGIAVGMTTEIPPHNLNELIDGLILLTNPNTTEQDIFNVIHGPDFPTGGVIEGIEGVRSAYTNGYGSITIKAKYHMEEKSNKQLIIIDEIPYGVNKYLLYTNIVELHKDKKIEGINSVVDESDRNGIRLVIELKKGVGEQLVLNQLFKHTQLRKRYHIRLLAIHNKKPKLFKLVELLKIFLEHRKSVVIRRSLFDLRNAEKDKNRLEGLLIASRNIDYVIQIIKESDDREDAKRNLIDRVLIPNSGMVDAAMLEARANAIVDMRLSNLTKLSMRELEDDIVQLEQLIFRLRSILSDETNLNQVIVNELLEIKSKFNSPRRTTITMDVQEVEDIKNYIPNDEVIVTTTKNGYIKRMLVSNYEKQNRGGKGKVYVPVTGDDYVTNFYGCKNHDLLLVITSLGRAYPLPVYKIFEGDRVSKGKPIVNLLKMREDERPISIIPISNFDSDIVLVSRYGVIKRISGALYKKLNSRGSSIIKLREGDSLINGIVVDKNYTDECEDLVWSAPYIDSDSNDDLDMEFSTGDIYYINDPVTLLIITKNGMSLRFDINKLRCMGRTATGVKGIKLKDNDEVIGVLYSNNETDELLTITENGLGKKTSISEFAIRSRGGMGLKCCRLTSKTGKLVSAIQLSNTNDIIILSSDGKMLRIAFDSIKTSSRISIGTYLTRLDKDSKVLSIGQCLD